MHRVIHASVILCGSHHTDIPRPTVPQLPHTCRGRTIYLKSAAAAKGPIPFRAVNTPVTDTRRSPLILAPTNAAVHGLQQTLPHGQHLPQPSAMRPPRAPVHGAAPSLQLGPRPVTPPLMERPRGPAEALAHVLPAEGLVQVRSFDEHHQSKSIESISRCVDTAWWGK